MPLWSPGERLFPNVLNSDGVVLGPIPKGTPVALLANLDLKGEGLTVAERPAYHRKVLDLLLKMKRDLKALPPNATDEQARKVFANLLPDLLALSKCRDYVVNRGHYFGTSKYQEEPPLKDDDKRALLEYLKTF